MPNLPYENQRDERRHHHGFITLMILMMMTLRMSRRRMRKLGDIRRLTLTGSDYLAQYYNLVILAKETTDLLLTH